jgi:hypothetical protein
MRRITRVLASWLVTGPLAAGDRAVLRPRRLHRRCPAPLPYTAGPGSHTGLDLRFLVAGPGFEPGKTVAGDFTDPARGLPDLGEHQGNPPLWHAFDMMAPYEPHSLAAWQLVHRSCRGPGRARPPTPRGPETPAHAAGRSMTCTAPAQAPQLPACRAAVRRADPGSRLTADVAPERSFPCPSSATGAEVHGLP